MLGVKQEELVPIVQMRKFTFKGVMSHIERKRGACELLLAYFVLISQVGFHDPIGVCDKESQRMWPHVEVKFQGGYIPLTL